MKERGGIEDNYLDSNLGDRPATIHYLKDKPVSNWLKKK